MQCGSEAIRAAAILRELKAPLQSSAAAASSSSSAAASTGQQSGLVHASCCEDPECPFPDCERLKGVLDHAYWCPRAVSSCAVCRRVWTAQETHSSVCVTPGCPVLSCRLRKYNCLAPR